MIKPRHPLFERRRDDRGVVLVLVALSMTLLIAACAVGVDIGRNVVVNRSLQSVADAGALDAARYVSIADQTFGSQTLINNYLTTQAQRAASDNGSTANVTATEGLWSLNTSTNTYAFTVPARCLPTVPPAVQPCNAVKVTASTTLGHLFQPGSSALSRSAIASINPEAGFSIGSYLASFSTQQSGVLNALLGKLGTSVNLTALGYSGLANTNVTVQQLIDASGGVLTPSNVLTTSLTGAQWVSFLNSAVASQAALLTCGGSPVPFPCTANTNLSLLAHSVNASTSATLCQLVSINGSTCAGGAVSQDALAASLNVLQTLTTEAEVANGTNALDVTSALNLGIAGASLKVSLLQIPQIAYGPVGTTASTAQVSSDLSLNVLGVGLLDVQIGAAQGTATLSAITCSGNTMTSTKITANTTAVSIPVNLLGLQIASAAVTGAPNTVLTYTIVPPTSASSAAGTNPQTVGTTSPSLSFGGLSLLNNLLVGGLLNGLLAPILSPVLQALGVNVAGAQVADLSTSCGSVALVQ